AENLGHVHVWQSGLCLCAILAQRAACSSAWDGLSLCNTIAYVHQGGCRLHVSRGREGRMNLPRFNAEASLYHSIGLYQASGIGHRAEGGVFPARRGFPCSMCDEICADGTGICDGSVPAHFAAALTAASRTEQSGYAP